MRFWGIAIITVLVLLPLSLRAEVEIESDGVGGPSAPLFIQGVDADQEKPLKMPKFVNPFENHSDQDIAAKVPVLAAQGRPQRLKNLSTTIVRKN